MIVNVVWVVFMSWVDGNGKLRGNVEVMFGYLLFYLVSEIDDFYVFVMMIYVFFVIDLGIDEIF